MAGRLTEFVQIVGVCDIGKVNLSQGNFTEISVPETLVIPCQKPDIEQVLKVLIQGEITDTKLISTPKGIAASGMNKTGKGLLVEGYLHQKIIYVAETETGGQPVHSAEFCIPFSTFLVINGCVDLCKSDYIDTEICIEDVYVEVLSPRKIFKNVTILVNATFSNTLPKIEILEPTDKSLFFYQERIPIKFKVSDCECIDRIEVEIINTFDSNDVVSKGKIMVKGTNLLLYDYNWDTSEIPLEGLSSTYTVRVKGIDCNEKISISKSEINIDLISERTRKPIKDNGCMGKDEDCTSNEYIVKKHYVLSN